MKTKSETKKIGLMGPFGHGNLGDAAIQQAMLQNIYAYFPDAQIHGFSLNPEDTEKRHNIPSTSLGRMGQTGWFRADELANLPWLLRSLMWFRHHNNRLIRVFGRVVLGIPSEILSLLHASRTLIDLDMFIVSGGGQLDDYWGGAWHHPYTLFIWALMSRWRKVPLYIVSVGAGPLDSPFSRLFDKWALKLATYRSYRDEDSKRFVATVVGFEADDPVYPDLAHSLQVSLDDSERQAKDQRPIIGVGPMSYFDPRVWPEKDDAVYRHYLQKLAVLVADLIGRDYSILFFTGEAVHDRWAVDDLREILDEMGIAAQPGQIIDEHIEDVDSLMKLLARTDMVIASRFHGVLLSLLIHKPVLALSYHKKINELMADTGQAEYCLSIGDFAIEILQERFHALEGNSQVASQRIAEQVEKYQAALDEQYEQIFANK